jgi:UDP:flavonoid glycosyltransferase YjiC (YdhE family)
MAYSAATAKHVLLVGEAATLAHVARPYALGRLISDDPRFRLSLACDRRCHAMLQGFPGQLLHLESRPSELFARALEMGRPAFDLATLRRYLRDDLRLLAETRPDAVIGDFRLSLAASARLARIPYIAIGNAYWSPYYAGPYPVPDLPALTHRLPLPIAQGIFDLARPFAFAMHARPMERLLRENRLPGLAYDLRRAYTDADWVLYADIPELFPLNNPPGQHRYLGAVLWDPPCELPSWWSHLPQDRPLVYLTLGSSGDHRGLKSLLSALGEQDVTVMLSLAGRAVPYGLNRNVFAANYLPGSLACERADLVICNGGSPTSQQALAAGKPLIGICRNLDQFLNMQGIMRAGAGLGLRADRLARPVVADTVAKVLGDNRFRRQAKAIQMQYAQHDARTVLIDTLNEAIQRSRPGQIRN